MQTERRNCVKISENWEKIVEEIIKKIIYTKKGIKTGKNSPFRITD